MILDKKNSQWLIFLGLLAASFVVTNTTHLAVVGLLYIPVALYFYWPFRVSLNRDWSKYPEVICLVLLMLYALISISWSPMGDKVLVFKELVRVFITLGFVLFLVSPSMIGHDEKVRWGIVIGLSFYGLTLIARPLYVIFTDLNQGTYYWDVQLGILRAGILYHQATAAWIYGIVWFLSLSLISTHSIVGKCLACFGVLISTIVVVFAHSRGAYIGVIVGVVFYFFSGPKRNILYLLAVLIFISTALFILYTLFDIEAIDKLIDRADSGRLAIWKQVFMRVLESPIFGHGFSAPSITHEQGFVAMHFHSVYIAMLYYGGIVALTLFLAVIALTYYQNYLVVVNRAWLAIVTMAITVFLVDGNHIMTYPSAELYMFIFPVMMMAANRMNFVRKGAVIEN